MGSNACIIRVKRGAFPTGRHPHMTYIHTCQHGFTGVPVASTTISTKPSLFRIPSSDTVCHYLSRSAQCVEVRPSCHRPQSSIADRLMQGTTEQARRNSTHTSNTAELYYCTHVQDGNSQGDIQKGLDLTRANRVGAGVFHLNTPQRVDKRFLVREVRLKTIPGEIAADG